MSVAEVVAHVGGSGHTGTAQPPGEYGSLEKHRVLRELPQPVARKKFPILPNVQGLAASFGGPCSLSSPPLPC